MNMFMFTKNTLKLFILAVIVLAMGTIYLVTSMPGVRKDLQQAEADYQAQWTADVKEAKNLREEAVNGPTLLNDCRLSHIQEGQRLCITNPSLTKYGEMTTTVSYWNMENGVYNRYERKGVVHYYILTYMSSDGKVVSVSLRVPEKQLDAFLSHKDELYVTASWVPDMADAGVYAHNGELFKEVCPKGVPLYLAFAFENREAYLEYVDQEATRLEQGEILREEMVGSAEEAVKFVRKACIGFFVVGAGLMACALIGMRKTAKEYGY